MKTRSALKWPSVEDATRRINVLIGDQTETDMAARDLIVLMRELGRVTAERNHLKYEEIIDNALEEQAALAAEPASGEATPQSSNNRGYAAPPPPPRQGEEAFDGPIMAQLVRNNAELMAARDAAREYGVQARLREKAAEDKRIHDTDALRAENAADGSDRRGDEGGSGTRFSDYHEAISRNAPRSPQNPPAKKPRPHRAKCSHVTPTRVVGRRRHPRQRRARS